MRHRPSPTQGPKQTLKDKHWWGTKTQTYVWKISIEAAKSWAWKMCDTQASLPLFQFIFQILCYSFHITSTRNVYAEIFAACAIRRPSTWSSQRCAKIHLLGQEGSDKEYCGDCRVRLLSTFSTVSNQSEQPWHRNVWKLWKRIQRPSPWKVR
jgi:hypothetical protein